MQKAVIIIPTYNESGNIGPLIDKLGELFNKIPASWKMNILVVDDSSPDGTADVVKEKMMKYKNLFLLLNKEKVGLGGAYIRGMSWAVKEINPDLMIEMDADFQHDLNLIPKFLEEIEAGADLVIAARYIKGGSIPKYWGLFRKTLSMGGNLFTRIVMMDGSIHDWTTGFRAVKPWVFLKVKDKITELKTYSFQISFLYFARKEGAKIVEIPLNFGERKWGESKLPALEGTIKTFWFVVKTRALDFLRSRFFKFGIVGFIGYIINALGLEFFYRFFKIPAGVAASLGAELAIISNFSLDNLWTFSDKKIEGIGNLLVKFLQFNLTSVGAIIIQGLVVGIGTRILGDELRQIMLVIAIGFFVLPFNYTVYNLFIWKTWKFPFSTSPSK